MQDQVEKCPCGYSLEECKCRQKRRAARFEPVWETIDPYELLDGLEQFPEWQAALIASLYNSGDLIVLPEGVTVRGA